MIRCKNVYKTFGDKKVLNGIDFEIPDGQIFGLLGPSGAGKTTLIKILTDQLSFDRGEIEILNKNVNKLTGDDKKKIILHLVTGEDMELQHGSDSAEQIYTLMKENKIEAIHSSEPNLETVMWEHGLDF